MTTPTKKPPVKNLVLDAGPLLSRTSLRGLASSFITPPSVLRELRDPKAREHWENLGLLEGVDVRVKEVDALSLSKVIAWAKHTGDFAVLSKADLDVLALTFALEVEENGLVRVRDEPGKPPKGTKPAHKLKSTNLTPTPTTEPTQLPQPTSTPQPQAGPSKPSPWAKPSLPTTQSTSTSTDITSNEVEEKRLKGFPSLAESAALAAEVAEEGEFEDVEGEEEDEDMEGGVGEEVERLESVEKDEGGRQDVEEDGDVDMDEDVEAFEKEFGTRAGLGEDGSSKVVESTAAQPEPTSTTTTTTIEKEEDLELEPESESTGPIYQDEDQANLPSDGEGDWITPSNVRDHKSLDLGLIPASDSKLPGQSNSNSNSTSNTSSNSTSKKVKGPKIVPQMKVACMTGDYAVQNVLLQMGLNLVGEGGGRIGSVKSWVLRCHACFKICKDNSKKFCPSCGNPTLIRASVTTQAPDSKGNTSTTTTTDDLVQVHLKPNFQYRTRGTIYSIPTPKMGSAKSQSSGGSGLILREDQKEFREALKREEGRKFREERRLEKAVEKGGDAGMGGWNDPDWMPEMLVVGNSGKGRRSGEQLPQVGHGRSNPNQARRKKK